MIGCDAWWPHNGDGNDDDDAGSGALVWMAIVQSGGQQCPFVAFDPVDAVALAEDAGIDVFAAAIEEMAVCLACHCPSYAATHYIQIRESDADEARELGFTSANEPDDEWRVPVDDDGGSGPLVWMAMDQTGGQQCPVIEFEPVDAVELAREAGVSVYGAAIEGLPVCEACHCPYYSALHYIQIRESKADEAEELGFESADEPGDEWRVPVG